MEASRPPARWPSDTGGLVFEDVVIGYGPSLPPVLKGVSLVIEPRQKVGIVSSHWVSNSLLVRAADCTLN